MAVRWIATVSYFAQSFLVAQLAAALGDPGLIRFTVKERILLPLLDNAKAAEAFEVPPQVTQEGIAEAIWTDVPHFAQYIRPMVREGFVREETAHVKGTTRRRKAYVLTDSGEFVAVRLREKLMPEVVRVRDEKQTREATIADVMKCVAGSSSC